jgi:chromosome segregation ATPase
MKDELHKLLRGKDEQIQNLTTKWKAEVEEARARERRLEEALHTAEAAASRVVDDTKREAEAERRALLREVDEWRQQAAQDAQAAKQQRAQLREKDHLLGEVEVKLGKFIDSEARLREALREKADALSEARALLDAADASVARLREEAEQKDDALEAVGAKLRALGQEVVLARRSAEEVTQRKCVPA